MPVDELISMDISTYQILYIVWCRITGSHDRSLRVWSTSSWECTTVIGSAHNGEAGDVLYINVVYSVYIGQLS